MRGLTSHMFYCPSSLFTILWWNHLDSDIEERQGLWGRQGPMIKEKLFQYIDLFWKTWKLLILTTKLELVHIEGIVWAQSRADKFNKVLQTSSINLKQLECDSFSNSESKNAFLIFILTFLFFVNSFVRLPSCSGYCVTAVTTVELTGCFKVFILAEKSFW